MRKARKISWYTLVGRDVSKGLKSYMLSIFAAPLDP
jgi:hypothetical protein